MQKSGSSKGFEGQNEYKKSKNHVQNHNNLNFAILQFQM